MVQFGYSYFLSSLFFGRKIMAVMQIDISSWCCQYGMPGHHQISQITKLHLVFVWRTWCFCFHSTWCFCFHSTWCFCLTTLGADAFQCIQTLWNGFLAGFFGPKKRLCHLQMDEPVADAVPEDNPADEASEGVVISKNISISFNGGKPV